VDPGPRNRGPTSLLALKIRTPVANTGKLFKVLQSSACGYYEPWYKYYLRLADRTHRRKGAYLLCEIYMHIG
jgi:hypothetical protein